MSHKIKPKGGKIGGKKFVLGHAMVFMLITYGSSILITNAKVITWLWFIFRYPIGDIVLPYLTEFAKEVLNVDPSKIKPPVEEPCTENLPAPNLNEGDLTLSPTSMYV